MDYAVTGHQPPLLGGFSEEAYARLLSFARMWVARRAPRTVISGMAPGWDLAVAEAAVGAGVPLVAALAWPEQGKDWPGDASAHLARLLAKASEVHLEGVIRKSGMWTARDLWVLSRGQAVVALWSGAPGGTAKAVAAAHAKGLAVENLWDEWSAFP